MDELWKYYAQWKNLVTKEDILNDFIYAQYPNRQIYRETE